MNLIKLGFQIGVVIFTAKCTAAFLDGAMLGIIKCVEKHSKKKPESDKVTNIRRDANEK